MVPREGKTLNQIADTEALFETLEEWTEELKKADPPIPSPCSPL
jgi:hypothetical protein